MKRILITTGDSDGIGLEVTLKAVVSIVKSIPENVQLIVFHKKLNNMARSEKKLFVETVKKVGASSQFVFSESNESPANWVVSAAKSIKKGKAHALVTAPLSKPEILKSGFTAVGHTELLRLVFPKKRLFMGFAGQKFNVLLATGHISIESIEASLSKDLFFDSLKAARMLSELSQKIDFLKKQSLKYPSIGVIGLNPHAGDSGIIGDFEKNKLKKWISAFNRKGGVPVRGPLIPDVCFKKNYWSTTSCYLSMYHDQGLIPFKMIHDNSEAVHITIGLPFVRTSVDHGTAKDIFGTNKADFSSMKSALVAAIQLVKD